MSEFQTILHVEMEESCGVSKMTFRSLRGVIREYTGEELPVCPDDRDLVEFYSEVTGNPVLFTDDLGREISGEKKRGVQIGSLLLVVSEGEDWRDDFAVSPSIMILLSLYLLSEGKLPPKPKESVIYLEDLDLIGEIVRTRVWIEEDPDISYFSAPPAPEEGVQMWTQEQARAFLSEFSIEPPSDIHPWGFSTQVKDLAPDSIDVDVVVYWDGDGTAVVRLRKEGRENVVLINRDCKKDYGWEKVGG